RDGSVAAIPDRPATLDAAHPVVARVLDGPMPPDPVVVSFLASAVYSAINLELGEVTDADEATFVLLHAAHIATTRLS
ncbi:MAG: hypothetical protein AAF721_34420, partial [Myxococcota bacterium]